MRVQPAGEHEKGHEHEPYLHGVGTGLPALLRALKLQKKAAKTGFDWPDEDGVVAKIREELEEVEAERAEESGEALAREIGDLLFAVVNLARWRKLDPEAILAAANARFEDRFSLMQAQLESEGSSLEAADLGEMERRWQLAKERSRMA